MSARRRSPGESPAAEDASTSIAAADVSRGTGAKRRVVSPEARQSAMRSRLDMGEALRQRGGSARPSDMFFTPTPATPESADSPDEAGELKAPDEPPASRIASRETSGGSGTDVTPESSSASGGADTPETESSGLAAVPGATFTEISVDDIHPNRKQPRQVFDEDELAELAYSIGELGVLQPIVVRPSRETGGPTYELVMGERRWRATQRAGLDTVPAIVRETSDDDLLRDALLENLHRSQLNPLEEAAAYQQLMEEFGATQEELSQRIGRSRPQISNTLRLMRLPPLVQRRVAAGLLSAGHARALLSLEDPAEMERLAQRIVAEGLSVRAAEETASLAKRTGPARRTPSRAQERHRERLDYIADAFSDKLDTSVKINLGARKGRMTIEFASVEDLNRIISVLDPQSGSEGASS
ncbi:ParB/RepB/Spo0J family partition protein [Kocuria palustris]|uniref:ParB/RepB/Spo0J family partition protein n=1 Tax=Kocuria palustris TaxID=71999 RepID=UPI0037BF61A5